MEEIKPYPVDPYYLPRKTAQPDPATFDIIKATQFGVISRCHELIESGEYDVNQMDKENVSLLHWAAINNQLGLVRYYVSKGATVDRLGGDLNSTPLNWATRQGHLPMVVLLMSLGADPNILDGEGCACIHIAAQSGHTNIVAYFLAKGVDPNLRDKSGMTALMWSSYRIIAPNPTRLLISWGADVNLQDVRQGNTAGHIAALSGNHFALSQLDNANIDWNILNRKGETAYQVLTDRNHEWMAMKLKAMMRERGLMRSAGIIDSYVSSRSFRLKVMVLSPVVLFLGFGLILHVTLNYWLKLALMLASFFAFRSLTKRVFDTRMVVAVPFGLASGTTALLVLSYFLFLARGVAFLPNLAFIVCVALLGYTFIRTVRCDPGYIPTHSRVEAILEVCEGSATNFDRFCTTCLILRPLRSKHCPACDRCVARFDHHCPWVYNCVGVNNHVAFIAYLTCLLPALSLFIYQAAQFWSHNARCHRSGGAKAKDFVGIVTSITTCHPWLFFCCVNALVYVVWVTCLLVCQLYQMIWLNMTTNERLNASRYGYAPPDAKARPHGHGHSHGHGHEQSASPGMPSNLLGPAGQRPGALKSPFDRGVVRNVKDLLGLGGYLGKEAVDWTKVMSLEQTNVWEGV